MVTKTLVTIVLETHTEIGLKEETITLMIVVLKVVMKQTNTNQRSDSQNRKQSRGCGSNPNSSVICYYKRCGLKGHKEDNCMCKANNLYHETLIEKMNEISDCKKRARLPQPSPPLRNGKLNSNSEQSPISHNNQVLGHHQIVLVCTF